jgi:hypothetical protein
MAVVGRSRVVAPAVAAFALAACAAPQPGQFFGGLQGVERAALDECREPVQARLCGAPDAGEACWARVVETYTALPDTVARKRFLIDSGCPSPRVEAWLPDPR